MYYKFNNFVLTIISYHVYGIKECSEPKHVSESWDKNAFSGMHEYYSRQS